MNKLNSYHFLLLLSHYSYGNLIDASAVFIRIFMIL